jgi:hypothetical protein
MTFIAAAGNSVFSAADQKAKAHKKSKSLLAKQKLIRRPRAY